MSSQYRYNVSIAVDLNTGQVVRGARELDRLLSQIGQGDLSRTRTLDREKLRAIQRSNQELVREHGRTARSAQRQYDEHLGSGFFSRLARGASTAFNRNFSVSGTGSGGGVGGFLGAAAGVAGGNIAASAVLSVVGGIASAMTSGIKTGMDYNRMQEEVALGFEVILRDGKKARDFMGQLARFAEESPMDLPGVYTGAQRLLAMGFNAKQVVPLLRAAGDAAAGLGKTGGEAAQKVDQITLALSQMWNKGRVSAEEMSRQLVEAGVPAWRYLADEIARTDQRFAKLTDEQRVNKVQRMAERNMLNARTAVAVIIKGIEQDFGGLGERIVTETTSGIETNLGDRLARILGTASGGLSDEYKKMLARMYSAAGSQTADSLATSVNASSRKAFEVLESTIKAFESGDATKLGLNVTSSMASAIQEGTANVMGAAAKMGKAAVDATAEAIGAQSPAKEFIKLGMWAAQGFMIGMQQGMKDEKVLLDKETLDRAIKNPIVQAFMEALRQIEGGEPTMVVGGQRFNPNALKPGQHPGALGFGMMGPAGWSTAAGNWQETQTNWEAWKDKLGLTDFGDVTQQLKLALALLNEAGGLAPLLRGDFDTAARHTQPWAASPFSTLPGEKRKDFLPLIYNLMNNGQGYDNKPVPVTVIDPPERRGIPSDFPPAWQIRPEPSIGTQGIPEDFFSLFEGVQSNELAYRAKRVQSHLTSGNVFDMKGDDLRMLFDFFDKRVGYDKAHSLTQKETLSLETEYLNYLKEELRYREESLRVLQQTTDLAERRRLVLDPTLPFDPKNGPFTGMNIDPEKLKLTMDALQRAHGEIIDVSRSANQLVTDFAPHGLRALQLPALATEEAFANLPPLIKRVGDTAEEFERQMDLAGQSIAGLFGNSLDALLSDPKNAMQAIRQEFKQFLVGLFRDYVESEVYNLLRPNADKPGTSIIGSLLSHFFGGASASARSGASSSGNAFAGVRSGSYSSQLFNTIFPNGASVSLPAMAGGAFGFGMPEMSVPLTAASFSAVQDQQHGIASILSQAGQSATSSATSATQGGYFTNLISGLPTLGIGIGAGLGSALGGPSTLGSVLGLVGGGVLGAYGGLGAYFALGGTFASGSAGAGLAATLGAAMPFLLPAAGALLIGAYLLGKKKRRGRDEQQRDEIFRDAQTELRTILQQIRTHRIDGAQGVAQAVEVYSQAVSAWQGLKTKSVRESALKNQKPFLDGMLAEIRQAASQQQVEMNRSQQLQPEFRDGGAAFSFMGSNQFSRRFDDGGAAMVLPDNYMGKTPGSYTGHDPYWARLDGDEVILNPPQWKPIEPYLKAKKVPGFDDGGHAGDFGGASTPATFAPVVSGPTRFTVNNYVTNNFDGKQIITDVVTEILDSETGQRYVHKHMGHHKGRSIINGAVRRGLRDKEL